MYRDFGPRKSRSAFLLLPPLRWSHQGIAGHNLKTSEKKDFFVTLKRLSERNGRLPSSMVLTEKVEVEDRIVASGGFADIRRGRYLGRPVAVKTMRVAAQDNFLKTRKVRTSVGHPGHGLNDFTPAILQGGHSVEYAISPERHKTRWGSGKHGRRAICHRVRVDGSREYHGIHSKESRQQTGTGK